eukprot:1382076-Amorphochlora_amoeboformis.AAC.1
MICIPTPAESRLFDGQEEERCRFGMHFPLNKIPMSEYAASGERMSRVRKRIRGFASDVREKLSRHEQVSNSDKLQTQTNPTPTKSRSNLTHTLHFRWIKPTCLSSKSGRNHRNPPRARWGSLPFESCSAQNQFTVLRSPTQRYQQPYFNRGFSTVLLCSGMDGVRPLFIPGGNHAHVAILPRRSAAFNPYDTEV